VATAAATITAARRRSTALGTAAALALYGVLVGIMVVRFPPFADESLYAAWTDRVAHEHDWWIALGNGKEPLLTWLGAVLVWLQVDPLTAVKLVSLLAGAVTVVATGLIAAELDPQARLPAMILAALVPFFVVHDAIGIMEPLLGALLAIALLLQIRLIREPTIMRGMLLGVTLGAALLTKRTGWIAVVVLPLSLLLLPRVRQGSEPWRRQLSRWALPAGLAAAIAVLAVAILRLSDDYDTYVARRDHLGSFHSLGTGLGHLTHWISENFVPYLSALNGYLTGPVLAAAVIGIAVAVRRRTGLALLLAAWIAGPFALAVLVAENPYPRYLYEIVAPLLALAAYGALQAGALALRRAGRGRLAITAVVAVVLVGTALAQDVIFLAGPARAEYPARDDKQFATDWPAGNAWVAAAHEIERRGAAGDGATCFGDCTLTMEWELRGHGFHLLDPSSEGADQTPYVLVSDNADLTPGLGDLREVWRYERPRHGAPLALLQRGLEANGRFVTTPDELRDALGLPDADFDAWLAAHAKAKAWYDAASAH
jgi:hypothetical protein